MDRSFFGEGGGRIGLNGRVSEFFLIFPDNNFHEKLIPLLFLLLMERIENTNIMVFGFMQTKFSQT